MIRDLHLKRFVIVLLDLIIDYHIDFGPKIRVKGKNIILYTEEIIKLVSSL